MLKALDGGETPSRLLVWGNVVSSSSTSGHSQVAKCILVHSRLVTSALLHPKTDIRGIKNNFKISNKYRRDKNDNLFMVRTADDGVSIFMGSENFFRLLPGLPKD